MDSRDRIKARIWIRAAVRKETFGLRLEMENLKHLLNYAENNLKDLADRIRGKGVTHTVAVQKKIEKRTHEAKTGDHVGSPLQRGASGKRG